MQQGWEAIRNEVLRRIRARDWLPGAIIPGEQVLAAEYGVARATMNRALRDLAEAGVLERRRKAGTRVALHPIRKARLDIPVTRLEVEGRGARYGLRLLHQAQEEVPAAIAKALGVASGARFLHLQSLHLADDKPFLFEDRWLNPAVLPDPGPDFGVISANEWLVTEVPLSVGDIAFSAANATAAEAAALVIAKGAALFIVERMTWTEGRPTTHVRLAYGPGYRMRTRL
jgi:GntR family histidine utilization transcriptional repressor